MFLYRFIFELLNRLLLKNEVKNFMKSLKENISLSLFFISKLKKLSEDSLTKQPEEVFDVLEKLGEG